MHNKLFVLLLLISCAENSGYTPAESAQDAGRQFIEAALDGEYKKARFYMLKDSVNLLLIQRQENDYRQLPADVKREYREASIRPLEISHENDSVTTFKYYHSANTKDTTVLKIRRHNDEWLVDLKSIIEQ